MKPYLYLDTETTGLGKDDQIYEIAWCNNLNMQTTSFLVDHTKIPSGWTLDNTEYATRVLGHHEDWQTPSFIRSALISAVNALKTMSGGEPVHLMGACPAFDDRMIRQNIFLDDAEPPWVHRLMDIETMVMDYCGLDVPPPLSKCRGLLDIAGSNPRPHEALPDALEVRLLHDWLMKHKKQSMSPTHISKVHQIRALTESILHPQG